MTEETHKKQTSAEREYKKKGVSWGLDTNGASKKASSTTKVSRQGKGASTTEKKRKHAATKKTKNTQKNTEKCTGDDEEIQQEWTDTEGGEERQEVNNGSMALADTVLQSLSESAPGEEPIGTIEVHKESLEEDANGAAHEFEEDEPLPSYLKADDRAKIASWNAAVNAKVRTQDEKLARMISTRDNWHNVKTLEITIAQKEREKLIAQNTAKINDLKIKAELQYLNAMAAANKRQKTGQSTKSKGSRRLTGEEDADDVTEGMADEEEKCADPAHTDEDDEDDDGVSDFGTDAHEGKTDKTDKDNAN